MTTIHGIEAGASSPSQPPRHPAFQTILRSVLRAQEERGAAEAAKLARAAALRIEAQHERDEQRKPGAFAERCCNGGVTVMDLQHLTAYLNSYAARLEVAS
jgi:hypothetical protein